MQSKNRISAPRRSGPAASVAWPRVVARGIASRRRNNSHRILACLGCLFVLSTLLAPLATGAEPQKKLFRVGFSRSMFANINENDAMAAVKVWSAIIAKERGVPTDPTPRVYNDLQDIRQALTAKAVDSIALNTDEYWKLRPLLDDKVFIVGSSDKSFTEEYIVLVHKDSKIRRIQDLRDRRLTFYANPRMTLAPIWLDTVLMKEGLPASQGFFRVTNTSKITKVVLPVFFRQTDACVVSRKSFKTMCDLNPQLGQHLKVILSSPAMVPSGFCFRRGYNDSIRDLIITELVSVMGSASGNQMMTLFQQGHFEAKPLSCLDSAFELLATHERLMAKAKTKP